MLSGPVARRYAEAVFEIGREDNTVDAWLSDVRLIAEYFANRQLIFVMGEPHIRIERKEAIVRDLLGDKIRPAAMGLALTLVERGLVGLAPRIARQFELLYDNYRGQAKAEVISAAPLDDASRALVTRRLEESTGKRILLTEKVDPSLIGGVMTRVGDTLVDGSVRRKLALLRRQIALGGDTGTDPLDGFDDLKPLLDLPGSGGVARALPTGAPTGDGSQPLGDGPAQNGGSSPAGSAALPTRGQTATMLEPQPRGSGEPSERGYERSRGKRGKGRRR